MSAREAERTEETEESAQPDGGLPANQTENPTFRSTPTEAMESTADGVAAFNAILWEVAKTFGIITLMLTFIFFLFMAFQVAQWGLTTL